MAELHAWFWRLLGLFQKGKRDAEMAEEIQQHLDGLTERNLAAGMSPNEARSAALKQFGGVEQIKEIAREQRVWRWADDLLQDFRFGCRLLRKSPGFTFVAVLTLALGIGANSAIFSVVNAVLLHPLPYPDFSRLVMVWERVRLPYYENDLNDPAPGNFADWRQQNSVFEDMAAIQDRSFNLTGAGEPLRVEGEAVSASLFNLLRVRPALGRTFTADEDGPGGPRVVVMGYNLWVSRFGGDPRILNHSILLNGASYTVVGIMPREFLFPDPANFHLAGAEDQLWVPIGLTLAELANHESHYLQGALARLKPGVSLPEVEAQMDGIAHRLAERYPKSNTGVGVNLRPLRSELVPGATSAALWILLGAVSFILLMACANLANLLLARASTRRRELAVRLALGAGRMRIVRQLLTESLLLALAGGALGVLLTLWGVPLLLRLSPGDLPLFGIVGVNGPVLAFTLLISALAGLAFGIWPALVATRYNVHEGLKEGARETAGGPGQKMRSSLVAAEIALGVVVLAGAGLLLRSFLLLEQTPLGFQPEGLLTFRVIPRAEKYSFVSQRTAFYQQALEKIGALPGVKSTAAVSFLPLGLYRSSKGFSIEGRPAAGPSEIPRADYDVVSPGYFPAMQIPLREGRDVSWTDTALTLPVIVINQACARIFWPNQDPLGKRIKEGLPGDLGPWLTVVGVVGDVREFDIATPPRPAVYFPISQFNARDGLLRDWVVRTRGNPNAVVPVVRKAIWSIDRDLPISRVRTMEQIRSFSLASEQFNVVLLGLFACLALALASVGVHGVTAYTIAQRTHEIGIRVALGAQREDVLKLILVQGTRLACIGSVIGVAASLVLTRLMSSVVYGVRTIDPLSLAGAAILLGLVALMACYLPARDALRIDPMEALRYE
jgi:putative ABC transport system permease protein